MTIKVNIHEAKTNLSKLLARVKKGQEIIIARSGKPVAKLVPFEEKISQRQPGTAKNKVFLSPDFNEPLPEKIIKDFEK